MGKFFRNCYAMLTMCTLPLMASMNLTACAPQPPSASSAGYADSSLQQPHMSVLQTGVWANEAVVSAFTYNYATYHQAFQQASHYFTPAAWQAYMLELNQSGNLNAVIQKKMVVSAVATGAPIVLQQGAIDGRYGWIVQLPVLVIYQNATQRVQQPLVITLAIVRVPLSVNERGLQIASFTAVPHSTSPVLLNNRQ